jgi:hypothetical protein
MFLKIKKKDLKVYFLSLQFYLIYNLVSTGKVGLISSPFEILLYDGNLTDLFYIPHRREIFSTSEDVFILFYFIFFFFNIYYNICFNIYYNIYFS